MFCFFVEISYYNLENRNHCEYVSKKIYESIFQKYWQFSICNNLFHIFWTYGLKKIHCWSLYLLFEIHQNLSWDPSKSQISCFFVEISLRTSALRAKISTMKHVILTMSICLESLSVTLSAGILLIMCSVLRCVKIPTFALDEIIRNRLRRS